MARRRRSRHMDEEPEVEYFRTYDLVWVKMRGYSLWPAQIRAPEKRLFMPNQKLVYFYGTNNYAWVHQKHIFPYCKYYNNIFRPGAALKSYAVASSQISRAFHRLGKSPCSENAERGRKRVRYPLLDNGDDDVLPLGKRAKKEKSKGKERRGKKVNPPGYSFGTVHEIVSYILGIFMA
ncbi:hypothetical protein NPIL_559291 [Nephila pilipes]|uniref:PWWP domain-containing protein n=1 Tax=Nephila pilipes TaxID=299642 RepID=A0A8X6M8I3_NEPPI|nr:hypothetical protein NPIL_559291 [Nephila pilipes]